MYTKYINWWPPKSQMLQQSLVKVEHRYANRAVVHPQILINIFRARLTQGIATTFGIICNICINLLHIHCSLIGCTNILVSMQNISTPSSPGKSGVIILCWYRWMRAMCLELFPYTMELCTLKTGTYNAPYSDHPPTSVYQTQTDCLTDTHNSCPQLFQQILW